MGKLMVCLASYTIAFGIFLFAVVNAALVARRLQWPVLAVSCLAGVVFGVTWEWRWGVELASGGLFGLREEPLVTQDIFMNLPISVGFFGWTALLEWFGERPSPTGGHLYQAPWLLGQPQATIVSGLFWGALGAIVGAWEIHKGRRA